MDSSISVPPLYNIVDKASTLIEPKYYVNQYIKYENEKYEIHSTKYAMHVDLPETSQRYEIDVSMAFSLFNVKNIIYIWIFIKCS